ncbi:Protein TRAUCO [Porphyridium purpureum]|uniref:Protein TRAUCO n=1 Tax=Porphyridium purpureum TaxID=35688 RepID=A0A5J4ZB60_PORPP|nr:Protein TRAUCO [Porphyridium purpureum]|eukprot:POR5030..scf295_1
MSLGLASWVWQVMDQGADRKGAPEISPTSGSADEAEDAVHLEEAAAAAAAVTAASFDVPLMHVDAQVGDGQLQLPEGASQSATPVPSPSSQQQQQHQQQQQRKRKAGESTGKSRSSKKRPPPLSQEQARREAEIKERNWFGLIPVGYEGNASVPVSSENDTQTAMVSLSKLDKAEEIPLLPDEAGRDLIVQGFNGYRSIRATHGFLQGSYYFEVKVLKHPQADVEPARKGWLRVGVATKYFDVETPVGYSTESYAVRGKTGEKFHDARGEPYGQPFDVGDVLGVHIRMPMQNLALSQPEKSDVKLVLMDGAKEPKANVADASANIRPRIVVPPGDPGLQRLESIRACPGSIVEAVMRKYFGDGCGLDATIVDPSKTLLGGAAMDADIRLPHSDGTTGLDVDVLPRESSALPAGGGADADTSVGSPRGASLRGDAMEISIPKIKAEAIPIGQPRINQLAADSAESEIRKSPKADPDADEPRKKKVKNSFCKPNPARSGFEIEDLLVLLEWTHAEWKYWYKDHPLPPRNLAASVLDLDSELVFYKNGQRMNADPAFRRLPVSRYFATIGCFKHSSAHVNFGPKFEFAPPDGARPYSELSLHPELVSRPARPAGNSSDVSQARKTNVTESAAEPNPISELAARPEGIS